MACAYSGAFNGDSEWLVVRRAQWKAVLAKIATLLRHKQVAAIGAHWALAADEFDAFRSQWERDQIELANYRRGGVAKELRALKHEMATEREALEDLDDSQGCFGRWGSE